MAKLTKMVGRRWFPHLHRWVPLHQGDFPRDAHGQFGSTGCGSDATLYLGIWRHHLGVSPAAITSSFPLCIEKCWVESLLSEQALANFPTRSARATSIFLITLASMTYVWVKHKEQSAPPSSSGSTSPGKANFGGNGKEGTSSGVLFDREREGGRRTGTPSPGLYPSSGSARGEKDEDKVPLVTKGEQQV